MPSMLISHEISVSLVLREMLAVRAMLACLPTGEGGRSARCSERERSVKVDTDPKLSTRLGFCGVALCASGARRGGLGREHVRRRHVDVDFGRRVGGFVLDFADEKTRMHRRCDLRPSGQ